MSKKWPGTKCTSQADQGITGALEVTVTKKDGTKKTVHSKLNGDGDVQKQNIGSVITKIESYVK